MFRTDMGVMRTEKEKAIEEAKKLMASMKYKEKEEKQDEEELSEIVEVLNESLNEMNIESRMLVNQLNKTESEKKMLEQAKQQAEGKIRQDYEAKLVELENGRVVFLLPNF